MDNHYWMVDGIRQAIEKQEDSPHQLLKKTFSTLLKPEPRLMWKSWFVDTDEPKSLKRSMTLMSNMMSGF